MIYYSLAIFSWRRKVICMRCENIYLKVALLVVFATLGAMGSFAADSITCPAGQTQCNGGCHNLANDKLNCGSCDNLCPGAMVCINGNCSCPQGQIPCNGRCIGTTMDPFNCGSCGKSCPRGFYCNNGNCSCAGGLTLCNGNCVDPDVADSNCGSCGNVCPSGTTCFGGTCQTIPNDDTD